MKRIPPPPGKGRAIFEVWQILSDRQWHRPGSILRIAKANRVGFDGLCDMMGIAESESGQWYCMPDESTPTEAPDGT